MEHFSPSTRDKAFSMLTKYGDGAVLIAGGTFFVAHREELFSEAEVLIDIKKLELNYIKTDGEGLKIGATTTLTSIMASDVTSKGIFRVLSETVSQIRPNELRNMATVGGDICVSAEVDLPTPLIALDGKVVIESAAGSRTLPLEDFYLGYLSTVLETGEIVTEIQVPHFPARTGAAFHKFGRVVEDIPIVNAAARITLGSDGKCSDVKIVLGSIAETPVRAGNAEKVFVGNKVDDEIIARAAETVTDIECISDIRASGELRKRWSRIAVEKVLNRAYERAKGGE